MNNINYLHKILRNMVSLPYMEGRELVIVCVGTDRSTGDSLAPLVGTYLSEMKIRNFTVYGTIDDTVHAMNIEQTIKHIERNHPSAFVIGIDACLGRYNSIGRIDIDSSPLRAGAGVGKNLPALGHCHIVGIVNVIGGTKESFILQVTKLSMVMALAKEITAVIKLTDTYLTRKRRAKLKAV